MIGETKTSLNLRAIRYGNREWEATMATRTAQTRARAEKALTSADLAERALQRRAVEAAIWGMPIVSVDAMRQAFFGAGAKYGDFVYLSKPADWNLQITTPNSSSLYCYFNYTIKDGPVVLDFPAAVGAGLFGSILDAWQTPLADVGPAGEDEGKRGRYLLLGPDFKGQPPPGYFAVRSATYNGYGVLRAIPATRSDEDVAKALALVKQLRIYPFSQAANSTAPRYIDIAGKLFDGIVRMDDTFFDSLARMVNEEPVQTRDLATMGQLRSLGIEKGREFKPDVSMRAILKNAAAEAKKTFMDATTSITPYWPQSNWGSPAYAITGAQTAFTYQTTDLLNVDDRGAMFFFACAAPKHLGAATLYLNGSRDHAGALLDGSKSYHLLVPPRVPASQFWAVTVYDLETAAFIRESPRTEINSYQDLLKNEDGSVDVFFGPKWPAGNESNWIYTASGKPWLAFFRFYGPEQAIHNKSWVLPDIEKLN
jgi:hypothetical protein